jgi:hypothetical protein
MYIFNGVYVQTFIYLSIYSSTFYTNFIIILSVVVVVVLGLHYYLYNAITSKNDNTLIWVPPKPKQQLPFGLGPPIEPIKIDDYEKTTYKDYEIKLLRESVQSIVMSGGISYLMSMKFGQMSLLIQAIMIPVNLFDNILLKKYVLGIMKTNDGNSLHNELLSPPTDDIIAQLNATLLASSSTTSTDEQTSSSSTTANEPRVVEITDEPTVKSVKKTGLTEVKTTTSASEID